MKLAIKQSEHFITELRLTQHILPKSEQSICLSWMVSIPCKTASLKQV